jgi:RNA polymerase sigma factor FliA
LPLQEDKKEILEKYGPYVRSLAATIRRQFSIRFELEELIAYGQIGLLEAAERFDSKLGANFLTFAHYRIKGAIFDGIRKMGELRGPDVRMVYLNDRINAFLGNLSDREQGGDGRPGSFDDDVRDFSSAVTGLATLFATGMYALDGLQLADEALSADQKLEQEELKERVRQAVKDLPERERQLLQGYYFEAKTLEEAGAAIGQSKSWASRLHARAIVELKKLLSEDDPPPHKERSKTHVQSHGERKPGGNTERAGKRGAVEPPVPEAGSE